MWPQAKDGTNQKPKKISAFFKNYLDNGFQLLICAPGCFPLPIKSFNLKGQFFCQNGTFILCLILCIPKQMLMFLEFSILLYLLEKKIKNTEANEG